ncbi:cyclic AMP receptor-like protein A isoform X2 [Lineus longissimus]|uniref:cyclic AMP receptor-like protein A isoform X2 n=1 Tax=Lineus longissimus TaxID=88925 RepID=UPI002B4C45DB
MVDETTLFPLLPSDEGNTSTFATLSCTLFPENPSQCDVIVAVKRGMAALSLIGSVFMIGVIWLFRKYSAFTQRLILYLSIAALLDSIAYLMGEIHPDGALCDFQAFWLNMFDWVILMWIMCVTFNLFMNAVRMVSTDRFEWAYHLLSWGFPLFISCLPFIDNKYGPAGLWCWIEDDWRWRFGIWYGPNFGIIALMFITYLYIVITVNRKVKTWEGLYDPDIERQKLLLKEDVKPLRAYPFVYLSLSIFPLVNRIQNAINPHNPVFPLVLLHAMSTPLQGAINAVVFGLDKETTSKLTPTQIKLAFQKHREASQSTIREYPAEESVNSSNVAYQMQQDEVI